MSKKISKRDRRNSLVQKQLVMNSQKDLELAIDNTINKDYDLCNSFFEKLKQQENNCDNNCR
jgi:hypothetical protein